MRHLGRLCIFCLLLLYSAGIAVGQRRDNAKHVPAAQPAEGAGEVPRPAPPQSSEDPEKLRWEIEKLKAETASLQRSGWSDSWKILLGLFVTVTAPLLLAAYQVSAQRKAERQRAADERQGQRNRAEVDALLKLAEIAMDAPSTERVRARTAILEALLADLVPDISKRLNKLKGHIGFANFQERFMRLLEAMASQPQQALLIAECYDILMPADDTDNAPGRISNLIKHLEARRVQP